MATRSRRLRDLDEDPRQLADDELLHTMAREPALVRAPTVQVDGELIVGLDRAAFERVLG